jgi:hypothetical protein
MQNRTDNKLKSVAKKLEELIPEGNAQIVYDKLREVMRSQKEYFETYSALSVLKLTLYIYSFKKTKNYLIQLNFYRINAIYYFLLNTYLRLHFSTKNTVIFSYF